MNREIKFRVWDKEKKEWYDVFEIKESMSRLWLRLDFNNLEISQYTGLKDKNGKEVYQGDILKVEADKEGYGNTSYCGYLEVTTSTCGFGLRMFNPTTEEMDAKWQPWDSSSLWHINDDDGKNIEVIGNIYENPELLK